MKQTEVPGLIVNNH
jgi:hypothetical protein